MDDHLSGQLLSGERVVWTGHPCRGPILRPVDLFLIPFSLLWAGGVIVWNVIAWTRGADLLFRLFGIPFLLFGLYITVGRFLIDVILRRRMLYAVTDRRVLIMRQGRATQSTSLDIGRLPALELDERPDGSGTIRFGTATGWSGRGQAGAWQPTSDPVPQFIRIENVRSVYELISRQAAPDRSVPPARRPNETLN